MQGQRGVDSRKRRVAASGSDAGQSPWQQRGEEHVRRVAGQRKREREAPALRRERGLQVTCRPTHPRFVFLSTNNVNDLLTKPAQLSRPRAASLVPSSSGSMVRSVIHSRFLLALLAALLLVPFVAAHDARALDPERRDLSNIFSFPDGNSDSSSQTSETNSKTDDNTSTTKAAPTTSNTDQTKTTQSTQANAGGSNTSNTQATQTSNTATQSSSGNGNQQSGSNTSNGNTQSTTSAQTSSPTQTPTDVRTTSYSTKQDGGVVTVVTTVAALASSSSSAPSPSQTGDNSDNSGISTGGIVGLSVAGGVALLAVVAFAVFKFSRKRYLDEYDDGA